METAQSEQSLKTNRMFKCKNAFIKKRKKRWGGKMSSSRGPGQMSSMPRSEAALWSPLEKGSIAPFQKKKPLLEARSL
jgi:hypothetical protein